MTAPVAVPKEREAEYEALVSLLMSYAVVADSETESTARHVALHALGDDHLWRDLGLPDRHALRELLGRYFPAILAANDKDMRWKRFFYKRLCGWQGFHT